MIESTIEAYFVRKMTAARALVYKFSSPGNAGVPDRVVIHEGNVFFVELKRPGEKPRALQSAVARRIRDHGGLVICINSKQQVDRLALQLKQRETIREVLYERI